MADGADAPAAKATLPRPPPYLSVKPWLAPARFAQLRALVEEVQPDIIHSYYVGTTLTVRLALGRRHAIPRVFPVPGPLHLEHPFFHRAEIATADPHDTRAGRASGVPSLRSTPA
jgi:hypothetical protein